MKIILSITFLAAINTFSFSQAGCTDPAANNFNPGALTNDGSCTYNTSSLSVIAKGSLISNVTESSGLVFTNGAMWTHNDSGNSSNIFKVDTGNAALLQNVTITNFPNVDWEDITADANYIYVGDFGNNNGTRTDLKILKIDKSQLTSTLAAISVTAQAINFSYSDQVSFASSSTHNFDCESVISIANSLYIFTKDRGDLQTRVYKLSKTPGTYTVSPYTSYNVNGLVTGADYNPVTQEVALIGYKSGHKNSFLWFLNDFASDLFFSGNKRRVELGNSIVDWQTEGITYISANEFFISCETSDPPATLYRTAKSLIVPTSTVTGISESISIANKIKIYPNPVRDYFEIESPEEISEIEIFGYDGKIIFSEKKAGTHAKIKTENVLAEKGYYFLKIKMKNGEIFFEKIIN